MLKTDPAYVASHPLIFFFALLYRNIGIRHFLFPRLYFDWVVSVNYTQNEAPLVNSII